MSDATVSPASVMPPIRTERRSSAHRSFAWKEKAMQAVIVFGIALFFAGTSAYASVRDPDTRKIGQGFYLPDMDLSGDVIGGTQILRDVEKSCVGVVSDKGHDKSNFDVMERNSEIFKIFASTTGIDYHYQTNTLDFNGTMNAVVQVSNWETENAKVVVLNYYMHAEKPVGWELLLTSDCWDVGNINPRLMKDVEELKEHPITDPTNAAQWSPYVDFLHEWGSHILMAKIRGSRFQQYTSVRSSQKISTRDLQIRACAEAEGTQPTSEQSLHLCEDFSAEQRKKTKSLQVEVHRSVAGGTHKTRQPLVSGDVTKDALNAFLAAKDDADQPTEHHFAPIWELLLKAHGYEQVVHNLAAAYQGKLATHCDTITGRKNLIQGMKKYASAGGLTLYGCWAKGEGAISNADCHWSLESCYCHGSGCVEIDTSKPVGVIDGKDMDYRNKIRTGASGGTREGVNNSCHIAPTLTTCHKNSWGDGKPDRWLWHP